MLATDIVARRALCIGLMALRAQAENGVSHLEGRADQFRQFGQDLIGWADAQGITPSLSNLERELHDKTLGEWDGSDISETFWRVEALKGLLWAVGHLADMPTYFDVGNPNDVYALIPINNPTQEFIDRSQIRSEDVIERERHKAQFLNWRARTEIFRLKGMTPPDGDSYDAVVRRALDGIEKEGVDVEHDGVDLLIDGKRLVDVDRELKGNIASICTERQLALEWICSDDENWDNAHCDT